MEGLRTHFTYANVMSTIAAFLALTGGTAAIALSGKNQVKKDDIAKGAVRSDDIAKNAVKSSDVAADTLGVADLGPGSVGTSETGSVPVARIERAAALSVSDAGTTTVPFDSDSGDKADLAFDPSDMWKPAFPENVVVPASGLYLITGRVIWSFDDTDAPGGLGDQGHRELELIGSVRFASTHVAAVRSPGALTIQEATGVVSLNAGAPVTVSLRQENDDASAVSASKVTVEVVWLGPQP
jgi:hypothetical protein